MFYAGIGAGLPMKLALNVASAWNMMKLYEEEGNETPKVVEEEGLGFISKKGLTLVIIK